MQRSYDDDVILGRMPRCKLRVRDDVAAGAPPKSLWAWLLVVALAGSAAQADPAKDEVIASIKDRYAAIERDLPRLTRARVYEVNCHESGEASVYRQSGVVKRVTFTCYMLLGQRTAHLYYDEGELFFAYITGLDYDAPMAETGKTHPVEDRLYVDRGRLAQWLRGKKRTPMPARRFRAQLHELKEWSALAQGLIKQTAPPPLAPAPEPTPAAAPGKSPSQASSPGHRPPPVP